MLTERATTLDELRISHELSLETLAGQLHIAVDRLAHIERGKAQPTEAEIAGYGAIFDESRATIVAAARSSRYWANPRKRRNGEPQAIIERREG